MEKLKLFWTEAKSKVTTWVALVIAGVSQLADHAEELVNSWPSLKAFLPDGKVMVHFGHWVLTTLGFLVVWTRVRRLVFPPKP